MYISLLLPSFNSSFLEDTFLQINDQINTVLTRYEAFKKGDYSTARNPIPPEIGSSSGGGGLSLIDLDDEAVNTASLGNPTLTNDLSGLFLAGSSQQFHSGVSKGTGMQHQPTSSINFQQSVSPPSQPQTFAPTPIFANGGFSGSSMATLQQLSHTSTPPASIVLPSTPGSKRGTPVLVSQSSSYFGKAPQQQFGGMGVVGAQPAFNELAFPNNLPPTVGSAFGGTQPQPPFGSGLIGAGFTSQQQPRQFGGFGAHSQQLPPSASNGTSSQQGKDPFADLAGLF